MRVLLLLLGVLVAGCGSAVSTTTVATTTSTSTSTTSTVATTTSTTMPPTTTTTVAAVDGVPEEALALIGAEMPAVPDLSEGFDAEVWFESYAAWNRWAFANPEEGLETLDLWVVPGSEEATSIRSQLERWVDEGWTSVRVGSLSLLDVEVADDFVGEGFLSVNALTSADGTVWILDSVGTVVASEDFSALEERRSMIVLRREGENWLLDSWQ